MQATAIARRRPARWWLILAVIALAAAAICVIVNVAVSGCISWALYPMASLGLALGTLAPAAVLRRHRPTGMLTALSALIMPFLLLLDRLSPTPGWGWSLAFPVVGLSLAFLWLVTWLYGYTRINRWTVTGILVLAALSMVWGIEWCITRYTGIPMSADIAVNIVGTAIALGLFAITPLVSRSKA